MCLKKFSKRKSSDKLKPEIEKLFSENRDEEVEKLLVKLARYDLSNLDKQFLWMYRGWIHFRRGENVEGQSYATKILEMADHGYFAGKAHHLIGLCMCEEYLKEQHIALDIAKNIFDEWETAAFLLSGHPERLAVIGSHARLLADLGKVSEAVELIESDIAMTTDDSSELGWLYAGLGEIFIFDANNLEQGKISLERAVELLDSNSIQHGWVHSLLAMRYAHESKFEKAISFAEKALDLLSKDPMAQAIAKYRAHYSYAVALDMLDLNLKEAISHCLSALEIARGQPKYQSDAYHRLGVLYQKLEQDSLALDAFDKALELAPDHIESYRFYWHVWMSTIGLGLWTRALACFDKCLKLANDTSEECDAYYQLGLMFRQLGKIEEAKDAFRHSLKKMPLYDRRRKKIFAFLRMEEE